MDLEEQFALFPASLAGDVATRRLRLLVLDALGAGLAGHPHPAPTALRGLAASPAEAQLIGAGRGDAITASAANAAAIHALDFDDTHGASLVHVSSVLVPVCLALAEREDLSLERFLQAYAFGLRCTAFGQRLGPMLNGAGFHTTAVLGSVVAAAAGGWILARDVRRAATAAELAATTAMGLTASFGTDTKPVQVGLGTANATRAALLSGSGISAPRGFTARDGLVAGLLGPDALALLRWDDRCDDAVEGVVPKPYPCCYLIHGAIRSALGLRETVGGGDRIEAVQVTIGPLAAGLALRPAVPGDSQAARFSTAYCVARALATGHVSVADFDDPLRRPADAETRRLVDRLTTTVDDSLGPVCARVRVRLASGQERESSFDPATSGAMPADDLVAKFRSNAARSVPADRAALVEDTVLTGGAGTTARSLARLLAGPPVTPARGGGRTSC
ncbi:MmgE/PrpD family protein [Streptomyces naphthomycinicus]|uniref:MmgE/PrpD family protein n=1 Tax=Streptomyces naphthomycinicus TaxID=2872625 RepID=UPI001CECA0FA|nr:MmgE/PrpD family protein [Streptomyces sp. TML10]